MKTQKLVTAVVTTYKRSLKQLLRSIKSIQQQTYENIEIIVVDDSPDSYPEREKIKCYINNNYDSIHYIQHEYSKGACAARNTGLSAACGEYIAFLDDDDEWLPQKIEIMVNLIENDCELALVYCNEIIVYDDSGKEEEVHRRNLNGFVHDDLLAKNYIGSTSIPLIRKIFLDDIGGFDVLMQSAQDYDVWLRLAAAHKVAFINSPLVRYHIHNGEQISKSVDKRISGLERLNQKNSAYLKDNKDLFWMRNIIIAPLYAQSGDIHKALTCWFVSFKVRPFNVYGNLKYLFRILKNIKDGTK